MRITFGQLREIIRKELNEAKESEIDALLAKFKKYNDSGKHTLALIELAKFLKNKKMEKILNQMETIGKELNNMPKDLQILRMFESEIRRTLRKEFETKFGREAYQRLEDLM